jgi:hypothetical protein
MMKLISSKDVIPFSRPTKVIRNFREFIKRFVFSFVIYKKEINGPDEKESIQIKTNTKGALRKEIHVKFLNKECSLALQNIAPMHFRLTFYIKVSEADFTHGTSLDLIIDSSYSQQYFKEIDVKDVISKHPDLDEKLFVPNYEVVTENLIKDLKRPVKELAYYAKETFPSTLNSFLYGEERQHLIAQVRVSSDSSTELSPDGQNFHGSKKELWLVRDKIKHKKWVFTCKTLYKLKVTQNREDEVTRSFEIPYSDLWKYFGVTYDSCDRTDIKMFTSLFLDSMKLEMPTMSMKHSINDDPDSFEEIHIKLASIGTISHVRHIINIENQTVPLTISLIGNDKTYFGVKATTYNRELKCEQGVFLRVDSEEWRYDEKYISELSKNKKKDPLKYLYSLPSKLEDRGFEYIFRNLKFNKDKVPFVENPFGDVTNIDVFTKHELDNYE